LETGALAIELHSWAERDQALSASLGGTQSERWRSLGPIWDQSYRGFKNPSKNAPAKSGNMLPICARQKRNTFRIWKAQHIADL